MKMILEDNFSEECFSCQNVWGQFRLRAWGLRWVPFGLQADLRGNPVILQGATRVMAAGAQWSMCWRETICDRANRAVACRRGRRKHKKKEPEAEQERQKSFLVGWWAGLGMAWQQLLDLQGHSIFTLLALVASGPGSRSVRHSV